MATDMVSGQELPPGIDWAKVQRFSGQRGFAPARDVANVVAFIASDAASNVHGAIWTADGGASTG